MRSLPFLLIACLALLFMTGEADAAYSPVAIVLQDDSSGDIMEQRFLTAELTLYNTDSKYRAQEIYLSAVWPGGIAWGFFFADVNYDQFEGNLVKINKGAETTIYAIIECEGECSAGDTNVVQIYGQTDPKFYNYDGNVTDSCGSSDCKNDTTAASASSNLTNVITMSLTAWAEYDFQVTCDAVSNTGDNKVYPSNTTQWGYTLTNTGWNSDNYQFTPVVTSADGHNVDYWTVSPGMTDGKQLNGQSDSSTAEGSISINPAMNATSGIYNVVLTVISNNGGQDSSCTFDVSVPENDTEERPTEEWTFYRDFVECDPDDNSLVTYNEFVDCLNTDLVNDGESMVNASSEFANEMFSMADLDMDGNLTSSEFDYIKKYPHESEEEVVKDETEDESKEVVEDEEIPEEVPSISLISSIAAIGIIALRRRY